MITKKSMLGLGSVLMLFLFIAGCGSDHHSAQSDLSGANNVAEPVAAQDAFVEVVKAVIAATSDETEPGSIDATTPTSSDNTAAVPIS